MTAGNPPPSALDQYRRGLRRARLIYGGVVAIVVVAVVVVFSVIVNSGEAAHAHLAPASAAPPSPTAGPVAASLHQAWTSTDATAIGQPVAGGVVVTYDEHTVTGRNVVTGAKVWTYTRTDSPICNVAVEGGKAVAFFRHNGNCDEVDAFFADTGRRAWARTLDQDGHPVNGTVSLAYDTDTVFAYTVDVIYAIEVTTGPCTEGGPGCGLSRWNYPADKGCRVDRVVGGTSGALVAQTCGQQYRVLLHDPYKEYTDKANTKPAVNWAHTGPKVTMPLAADSLVLVGTAPGIATSYDPVSGKVRQTIRVPGVSPTVAGASTTAGSNVLVWSAGHTTALDSSSARVQWSASTGALPAVDSQGRLFVGSASGLATLDPGTGQPDSTVPAGRDLAGIGLVRVASGVVLTGTSTAALL